MTHPSQSAGANALKEANNFFIEQWQQAGFNTAKRRLQEFPVLLMNQTESTWELLWKNTSQSFYAAVPPFDQLKAIAHMAPCLSAIGIDYWENGVDWHQPLQTLQRKWEKVVATMNTVDWSNPAFQSDELIPFVQQAIKKVNLFINERMRENSYSLEDYRKFGHEFHQDAAVLVFLGTLVHAYKTYFQIKQWKEEIGPEAWNKLMVVIYGDIIPTIGLTIDTNPFAMTVSSLMAQANIKENILIAPSISTKDDALTILGNALNRVATANALFPTKQAQEESLGVSGLLHNARTLISLESLHELLEMFEKQGNQSIHPFLLLKPDERP